MMRYILVVLCIFLSYTNNAQNFDTFLVHFDIGSYELKSEYDSTLHASLKTLGMSPQSKILVYGYSDYLGETYPNYSLSENRANAVKKWYLQHNVDDTKFLIVAGLGQQQKLNYSSGEYGNVKNRKTMILISKRSGKKNHSQPTLYKPKNLTIKQEIIASKIGQTIILKDIFFEIHTDDLKPNSIGTLTELLSTMRDNRNLKISIEGHICCNVIEGSNPHSATYKLSTLRAKKIYEYLLLNGISSDRVTFTGFGRTKPIYPDEKSEEEMAANRRVELRIISK